MSEKTNGKTELIMRELTLRRNQTYEKNAGKYTGSIQYEGAGGTHTLTLDEVISERVLAFIGPVICEAAAMVAEETKKNIARSIEALDNQRAIEAGDLVNAGVSQTEPPTPAQPVELFGPDSIPPCDRVSENIPTVPREPGDMF